MPPKRKATQKKTATKTKATNFDSKLAALGARIDELEVALERERKRNDQLLELSLILAKSQPEEPAILDVQGFDTRLQPSPQDLFPNGQEWLNEQLRGAGSPARRATRLSRARVERKVVAVIRIMASPVPANPSSSFGDDDLDWDGLKKRAAFIPIDQLMRDDGVRISGIGPSNFTSLEDVPEMVDLVHANQAPV